MKHSIILALVLTLSGVQFGPSDLFGQSSPKKRLREIADELSGKGIDTAPSHIVQVNHGPDLDFEELISLSPVVVLARYIDFVYRMNEYGTDIETVLKFQKDEIFRGQRSLAGIEPGQRRMPARTKRLGRPTAGEFLLFQPGGYLVVNGVRFRSIYTGTPKFEVGKLYLLFLKKLPSDPQLDPDYYGTELHYSAFGPKGAFEITDDYSTVKGLGAPGSPQRTQLLLRFLNRVEPFFEFLRDESKRQDELSTRRQKN